MRKFLVIWIIGLFFSLSSAQSGRYAASFLELGAGARTLAMGGAAVAGNSDVTAVFYNPGQLGLIKRFQAGSMYANLFNKLEQQSYVGAVVPLMRDATISISWMRLSVDEIPRFDFDEEHARTAYERLHGLAEQLTSGPVDFFSNQNDVFIFSFSRLINHNLDLGWQYFEIPIKLGFGANIKYIRQKIDKNTGSGIGLDFGFLTSFSLNDVFAGSSLGDLSFGLNAQDLTQTRIVWNTDSKHADHINRNFKFGFAYIQPLPFMKSILSFNYDMDSRYDGNTHIGGELLIRSLFAIRLGANAGYFTAGAGISLWKFRIDYAYQSHDLGNSHRVSLILVF